MSFQPEAINDDFHRSILREALKSRPTPFQSNYYVHTIAITESGLNVMNTANASQNKDLILSHIKRNPILGSNHEYGITSAIHGEESIRANWAEKADHNDLIKVIGFATKYDITNDNVALSCGNCRDVLKDIIAPEGYIIEGNPDGQMIKFPLSRMYFENFRKVPGNNVIAETRTMVNRAIDSMNKSYDYTLGENNKSAVYGAAILTESKEIFSAGFEGDIAYHPSLPLRNAQILLKQSPGITKERLSIDKIVVVQKEKPKVPYKDRQQLMEFVEATNAYLGKSGSVPIYLFEVENNGAIKNRWRTDSSEWLPFPFSPKTLGLENELKNSVGKLFR